MPSQAILDALSDAEQLRLEHIPDVFMAQWQGGRVARAVFGKWPDVAATYARSAARAAFRACPELRG